MFYWLAERAIKTPGDTALIYEGGSWSFAALNERTADLAARLAAAGVRPGDHVAVLMPNRPEYVFLIFALARMGAVLVPLNTRLTVEELRWQMEQADCSMLICAAETEVKAAGLKDALWKTVSVDAPSEAGILSLDESGVENTDEIQQGRVLRPGEVQAIIYTSGTTGKPKGAMITFANQFHSAAASAQRLGVETAARWLLCMPLYHVGGLSIVLRACLYGTTVVLHNGFDAQAVSEALDRDAITTVSLVPTMLHRLLEARGEEPFPGSLHCVLLGGAAAPRSLIDESIARGVPIALTYGLTEACSQVATATPDEVRAKPGTVGKALMNIALRIVNPDGSLTARREIGEIAVAGMTVMKGYYNEPNATQDVVHGNWLHTGDLGYLDEDGDLWVVQRRTDLIVSGGENVYPSEVEAVLEAHPGVVETCVVGIEDAEWSQRVAALIVPRNGGVSEEDVISYCRERIASYKLPRVIVFGDALPRTASGKVQRDRVAQIILDSVAQRTPARGGKD